MNFEAVTLVDVVQSVGIIINTAVLIYVVIRLDKAFERAASRLGAVISAQVQIQETIERTWKRVDEIELRQGIRNNLDARMHDLMAQIEAFSGRLTQLEKTLAARKRKSPPKATSIRLLHSPRRRRK